MEFFIILVQTGKKTHIHWLSLEHSLLKIKIDSMKKLLTLIAPCVSLTAQYMFEHATFSFDKEGTAFFKFDSPLIPPLMMQKINTLTQTLHTLDATLVTPPEKEALDHLLTLYRQSTHFFLDGCLKTGPLPFYEMHQRITTLQSLNNLATLLTEKIDHIKQRSALAVIYPLPTAFFTPYYQHYCLPPTPDPMETNEHHSMGDKLACFKDLFDRIFYQPDSPVHAREIIRLIEALEYEKRGEKNILHQAAIISPFLQEHSLPPIIVTTFKNILALCHITPLELWPTSVIRLHL